MSSMFSSSWYRVSNLKLQLKKNIEIHSQAYGFNHIYILQDHSKGKFYRFNQMAYDFIGRLNGEKTINEVWEAIISSNGDDAPTQDEVIGIINRLHNADALLGNVSPDCLELFRRGEEIKKQQWLQKLRSPMSLKIPLFDPDKFLNKITPIFGHVFSRLGFLVWFLILITAVFLASPEFSSLFDYASIHTLEVNNLILLVFVFPIVKLLHEFGHAITTKKWGGEVHEMGISFLVFIPVPYVDASASTVCHYKHQRMIVSAAGMMVELCLASIALILWLYVEDGIVKAIAYNIMLIAGVSTLVFNGNPLLRFDAYYILEDYLEIPSLASRSTRYLAYLIQRYLFFVKAIASPVGREGEEFWLFSYGIASTLYKWFITVTIVWYVAGQFFILGIFLAIWAIIGQIILPISKVVSFLLFDPKLNSRRILSLVVSGAFFSSILYLVCVVPVPSVSRFEAVLTPSENSKIISSAEGFVSKTFIHPFEKIQKKQQIYELYAPLARSELEVLQSELNELRVRYRISKASDMLEANLYEQKLMSKRAELEQYKDKYKLINISSPDSGDFIPLDFYETLNRYIKKGDLLGYVLNKENLVLQVIIPQSHIGLIKEGYKDISVMFTDDRNTSYKAKVISSIPAAQNKLPSKVLGKQGGGAITVMPNDEEGITTLESVFQYEISLEQPLKQVPIGMRAFVRFNHGETTIVEQCYRVVRQLFLGRFGV